ncbi:MAG TPA: beta-3-deoxy-D-manno-oct-2-ulosonic acid transferase [Thermodesulfobacterium commune]|nr:MAG: Capsule polysaccharide biosynthesis protein [Desulfonauticus sp. 38_4375]HCP10158.1 beta-3-deoxy-D-manno-oct-2-ulosonic acid transferase [Thermodesulfobacterium commune]
MKSFIFFDQKLPSYTYKFNSWKRYLAYRFFPNIKGNLKHHSELKKIKTKINLYVWGVTLEEEGLDLSNFRNINVIRVEDGFIRSVGLGVRLTPPISLVADPVGIYYNSTKPSYLEEILLRHSFPKELIERARNIINTITNFNLTKYNIKEKKWKPPKTDKKIILVVGQVETDMSIKYGSPYIKTNLQLLQEVRKRNPHEYIVYKPHPDVANKYKKGEIDQKILFEYCNEVCPHTSIIDLINHADEICVNTSLAGFEALIRGKKVICFGQPFYSGYGLTQDIYPVPRRNRNLTIEELVAGAIILYPVYVSIINNHSISPEEAIREIILIKKRPPIKLKFWNLIQKFVDPFIKIN